MKKILIVEDEEVLANVLNIKLTKVGYDVAVSVNGEDGLAKISEWNPDVILLDIVMPKMNGYEVMENLYEKKNKIPIIVISNSGQEVELEKIKKLGASDYIVKTQIDPEEVVEKIKNVLSGIVKNSYQAKEADLEKKVSPGGGAKVLLVEDDSFLSDICSKKLQREGFNVAVATDGGEAIRKVEDFIPAIVLLDIVLPVMDGFEVLKRIRSNENNDIKNVPVIMLSNLGQEEDNKKAFSLGADDYLVKAHFTTEEIVEKIKSRLELK